MSRTLDIYFEGRRAADLPRLPLWTFAGVGDFCFERRVGTTHRRALAVVLAPAFPVARPVAIYLREPSGPLVVLGPAETMFAARDEVVTARRQPEWE